MTLVEIFFILIIHWVADFILQSDEDAKGKSKYMKNLVSHTFKYSLFLFGGVLWYSVIYDFITYVNSMEIIFHNAFGFAIITFVFHTITDYFTSRLNAKLWAAEKRHPFFVSIGFDQLLHYAQLFITFYIIYKK